MSSSQVNKQGCCCCSQSFCRVIPSAGYIIGLGDRHSHNILLDRKTAEVVHIDLGVAFEQGRFLNTPELVPFRLTSNIVDGMGATGQPNNKLLILNTAQKVAGEPSACLSAHVFEIADNSCLCLQTLNILVGFSVRYLSCFLLVLSLPQHKVQMHMHEV